MATLRDVLRFKGPDVFALSRFHSVGSAVQLLLRHQIGSIVVLDGDAVAGVLAERDLLTYLVTERDSPLGHPLLEVLEGKPAPAIASPDASVAQAMRIMTRRRQRHLPVCEDGSVVGLVSVGDILHHMTRDLQGQVVDMTAFVHGPFAAPGLEPLVVWHGYNRRLS